MMKLHTTALILLSILLGNIITPVVGFAEGLSDSEIKALTQYPTWVGTTGGGGCGVQSSGTTPSTAEANASQKKNAKTVIGIAKTDNLGKPGALIGLMVALAESTLFNQANSNVPISETNPAKEGSGSDADSVGIFQQRPTTSWSTFAPDGGQAAINNKDAVFQLMTPAYAAEAFFGSTNPSSPSPLRKGLMNISNWQSLTPWKAAQTVQASASGDGNNYRVQLPAAQKLLDELYDASPAIPLPVEAGASNGTASVGGASCSSAMGDTVVSQAVIQAGLSEIAKNIPYVYGGGGPTGPSGSPAGFDCSSLMQYVLKQGANIDITRTAGAQYNETVGKGHSVQLANIKPGDLIFYGSSPSSIGHVVMFIGNNTVMEAPHTGVNIRTIQLYKEAQPGEPIQGIGFYPPVGG